MRVRTSLVQAEAGERSGNGLCEHGLTPLYRNGTVRQWEKAETRRSIRRALRNASGAVRCS